jgi:MFS family permease
MLAALAIFFASSAVCATAKTMQELIIGRAFQGTAGGGLILLVHVCISDLFSLRMRSLLMVSHLLCCAVGVSLANIVCVGLH